MKPGPKRNGTVAPLSSFGTNSGTAGKQPLPRFLLSSNTTTTCINLHPLASNPEITRPSRQLAENVPDSIPFARSSMEKIQALATYCLLHPMRGQRACSATHHPTLSRTASLRSPMPIFRTSHPGRLNSFPLAALALLIAIPFEHPPTKIIQ